LNSVRARIRNFEVLAANQIQRQAQRIVFDQQRAALAQQQYNQAVEQFNSCAASIAAY
jgi:hypothetical protein